MLKRVIFYSIIISLVLSNSNCIVIRERERPPKFTTISKAQPLEREKAASVNIRYSVGELMISAIENRFVYKFDLDYDENNFDPAVTYSAIGGHGQFDFRMEGSRGWSNRLHRKTKGNKLDLQMTTAVPIDLNVGTGASESRIDLSKIQLKSLDLKTGIGSTNITVSTSNPTACDHIDIKAGVGELKTTGLANANFKHLSLKTGVGEAYLDLTGTWRHDAEIDVKAGVGHVTFILPRELGVELLGKRSFLSSLHLDSFHKSGNFYISNNYDTAKYHLRIRIKAGIGSIEIRWA